MKLSFFIAAFGIFLFPGSHQEIRSPLPENSKKLSIFDSSLLILKDFVANGDMLLGFTDTAEFRNAWIDTVKALPVVYFEHDSALTPKDNELKELNRVMMPVFVRKGNDTMLRSSITFDSTANGWQPIIFENGKPLISYLNERPKTLHKDKNARFALAMFPEIFSYAVMSNSKSGSEIIPNASLRLSLGKDFPGGADDKPIKMKTFFKGLVKHLKNIDIHIHIDH